MSLLRLFVAVPPDESLAEALVNLQQEIARSVDANLRFIGREALHATVAFLGDVEEERVDELCALLRQAAGSIPAPEYRGTAVTPFPDRGRCRGLQLNLEERAGLLTTLNTILGAALNRAGFSVDRRGFRPHITLARVRGRRGGDPGPGARFTVAGAAAEFRKAGELVLYRSLLEPDGARYIQVRGFAFAATDSPNRSS